ncbi:unnamed protein product [Absidia cylindrospora]
MLVMSHHPSSSGTTGSAMNAIPATCSLKMITSSPPYDALPEPRSIVASSSSTHIHQQGHSLHWFGPPPPPPPPFATAAAALASPYGTALVSPSFPPPPPPTALMDSFYTTPSTGRRDKRPRKAPHELLTEAEKKANHIASEQKRRQNIRMGFDCLIDAVPTLNHGNRSEALILQKAIDHIHYLISVKNELKNQVRDLQTVLGDTYSSDDDQSFF